MMGGVLGDTLTRYHFGQTRQTRGQKRDQAPLLATPDHLIVWFRIGSRECSPSEIDLDGDASFNRQIDHGSGDRQVLQTHSGAIKERDL